MSGVSFAPTREASGDPTSTMHDIVREAEATGKMQVEVGEWEPKQIESRLAAIRGSDHRDVSELSEERREVYEREVARVRKHIGMFFYRKKTSQYRYI